MTVHNVRTLPGQQCSQSRQVDGQFSNGREGMQRNAQALEVLPENAAAVQNGDLWREPGPVLVLEQIEEDGLCASEIQAVNHMENTDGLGHGNTTETAAAACRNHSLGLIRNARPNSWTATNLSDCRNFAPKRSTCRQTTASRSSGSVFTG